LLCIFLYYKKRVSKGERSNDGESDVDEVMARLEELDAP